MNPNDPRHGTTRGYAQGCHMACCREAYNADEARRRKYREVLGITRTVPALGTQRRIRALMAIGWTSAHISARCGWTTSQAVTELLTARKVVYTATAQTVARVYDDLSMTPGPSVKNRREAARKGWAPPLAWDCIDTDPAPAAVPRSCSDWDNTIDEAMVLRVLNGGPRPRRMTTAEAAEVVRRLLAQGLSSRRIEQLTGIKTERHYRVGDAA